MRILPKDFHPYEISGIFHKSHGQQDVTSFKFPEDHGKMKSKFCDSFFFIFSAIGTLTEAITLNVYTGMYKSTFEIM